ncbi:hypothetical protein PG911_14025 [Tenacibaculum ovolyticum]|uniref:hypothetical protein n=1 Tax=Tenacibaculum ovolyticum TaxID=104270 RepID=UPI0022F3BFEE|nr:hypothetical protein [Tenacibaculum ovolyticum]WBX75763.1 hypothetical protein PG911_14025 [Tenacibaculum ovolyticum]
MKKFIFNIFIFLAFSSLFYLVTLFFWGQYAPNSLKPNLRYKLGSYGHLYSRISDIKNQNDLDILFLGSSHSYRGFDTRIFSEFGYKTFNLGSSSQTPIQTKVLLDRYLNILNPETVIYEVYPETFTFDGVESSLDIISNDKNDLHSFKMILKTNNIKTYNTFIYSVTRDLFNLNKSFIESQIKGNDIYIPGGYVEKKIGFFKPTTFKRREIKINNYQLESFSEIVKLLKKKNRINSSLCSNSKNEL